MNKTPGWRSVLCLLLWMIAGVPAIGTVTLAMADPDTPRYAGAVEYPMTGQFDGGLRSGGIRRQIETLTLITGDHIQLDRGPDGRHAVTVDAASREGEVVGFDMLDDNGQVYVFPSDVLPLLDHVLDRELFNVTKLAAAGYTAGVPVIVTYTDEVDAAVRAATPGMTTSAILDVINSTAATIDPDGVWWRATSVDREVGQAQATGPLAGVERVWLDEMVGIVLDESVPQIGAPEAWDAGFDGTGVTVAVLDTGIDSNHPDLVGKVVAEANFTISGTTLDVHGHGTHVAGIIAGSGTASEGTLVGAAPGAELFNAKVLDDSGSGPVSGIIQGMQWAVAQGADVVNMSIGSGPTNGTDPLSTAVNNLTAQHDVLFVVAAGNSGGLGAQGISAPGAANAALTVGAVDKDEELAGFSSRGPRRGDLAIKPDITAPGVGIVAARAAGTDYGTPVDDYHTQLSGTSMAAPHVAAAAAILLQQEPDLGAADLKAALTANAVPHPDLTVYQQGGGRVDVFAALSRPLQVAPSSISLGYFEFPQDGTDPVDAEVTYLNLSDDEVTFDLTLEVASSNGDVPPLEMLSIAPSTLMLDPGEEASVTLTLDVREGDVGLYGGYLIAEQAGVTVARTAVGFFKQPESVVLTVEGIARDGRPAIAPSSVDIINLDDYLAFNTLVHPVGAEPLEFHVPPGNYSIMGRLWTFDINNQLRSELAIVGEPDIAVFEDTTVVLDAGNTNRITTQTPDHETEPFPPTAKVGYMRASDNGGWASVLSFFSSSLGWYVNSSDPITHGELEFVSGWRLGQPELLVTAVDPETLPLSLYFPNGPVRVDLDDEFPLVDAGFGTPGEFDAIDAEGAVALIRRGVITLGEKAVNAANAGAVAAVIANNVPGPLITGIGVAPIPAATIPMEEGDELQGMLAQGDVTVYVRGLEASPYLYEVLHVDPDALPEDPTYTVHAADLASIDITYHTDIEGHEIGELRHSFSPRMTASIGNYTLRPGPIRRTEYLTANEQVFWSAQFLPAWATGVAAMFAPHTHYEPGQQLTETWSQGPAHPTVFEGGALQTPVLVERIDNTLTLQMPEWTDAHPGHWSFAGTSDQLAFRLYRDGQLIAQAPRPTGAFSMSPDQATYRMEVDVARAADWWRTSVATHTAWTVYSEYVPGRQVLPVLLVDYDAGLDALNTGAWPSGPDGATVEIAVRHQQGADGSPIAGASLETSYNDGGTWVPQVGQDLGNGRFRFDLDPEVPPDARFVSVRVEAWDGDDNRVEQEILRAWQLPELFDSPVNVTPPAIEGGVQVGEVLAVVDDGEWDSDSETLSFTYRWLADGAEIDGATGDTYLLTEAEVGATVFAEVTATDIFAQTGTAESNEIGPVEPFHAPVNVTPPTIEGGVQIGEVLTVVDDGEWDSGSETLIFTYRWLADGAEIDGATGDTYLLTEAEIGAMVSVLVVASDTFDQTGTAVSNALGPVEDTDDSAFIFLDRFEQQ